jgi:hypothetical protein
MTGCSRLNQSTDSSIDPEGKVGERIADMQLDDGTRIEAAKNYKVAGCNARIRVDRGTDMGCGGKLFAAFRHRCYQEIEYTEIEKCCR